MAKSKQTRTQHSQVRRDLRSPKYRMRVVEDKTKYNRNRLKDESAEGLQKAA